MFTGGFAVERIKKMKIGPHFDKATVFLFVCLFVCLGFNGTFSTEIGYIAP